MEKLRRRRYQTSAQPSAQNPMAHHVLTPTLYHNHPLPSPTNVGATPVSTQDPLAQMGAQSILATDSTGAVNPTRTIESAGANGIHSSPSTMNSSPQSSPTGSTPPITSPGIVQQPHQFDKYSMLTDSTLPSIAGYFYAIYLQELFCKYFKVENGQLKFELDKMSRTIKSQMQYKGRGLESLEQMFAAVSTKSTIDQAIEVGSYVLGLAKKVKVKYDGAAFPDPSGTVHHLRKNFEKKLAELEKNMKELEELKKKGGGQGSTDPWANVPFRFQ